MALEGNLKDLSLSSLVQMICVEQRRLVLVLRRHEEEGTIYFDKGDVVHATAGSLDGEEAVYYLLTWREGSFLGNANVAIPRRTISAPWNQLLMEGMRRLDERSLDEPEDGPRPAPAPEPESAIESRFIHLLSTLDHLNTRLADKQIQRRPTAGLQILAEMVNEVVEFAERHAGDGATVAPLETVLAKVGEQRPMVRRLEPRQNRLTQQDVWAAFEIGGARAAADPFADLAGGLAAVVDAYLSAVVKTSLRSSRIAGDLTEAYHILMGDLSRSLGNHP